MNAAIYTRVSTRRMVRHGENETYEQRPEVQEAPLRAMAQNRGWTITRVYSDRASGAKEARPGLDQLLADARRRRFDVLMVWRFDRLSRRVVHFLQLVEELGALGVQFVSHEQSFDTTTPMGRFTLTMFGALADLEREVIRERVIAGLEHARTHGTKSGRAIGRPRVVFDRDKVRELRGQGQSWSEIARLLGLGVGTVRRAHGDLTASATPCQNPAETHPEGAKQGKEQK